MTAKDQGQASPRLARALVGGASDEGGRGEPTQERASLAASLMFALPAPVSNSPPFVHAAADALTVCGTKTLSLSTCSEPSQKLPQPVLSSRPRFNDAPSANEDPGLERTLRTHSNA